ncbi:MAG: DUF1566 domain-containing protein [Chlorobium sp.]|nr:DUF1566 domain-containing protein [Chlorobium sp.]
MDNFPIKKLTALSKHFGADLLDDSSRCAELLSDFCIDCRLEANLLIAVLQENCAKELRNAANDGAIAFEAFEKLTNKVQSYTGIVPEYIEWAIKAVATILNLRIDAPKVVEQPISITTEYYEAVCNILFMSGNNWKDPTVWAKIDGHVKQLCAKTNLNEREIREWMREAWPSVEPRYEAMLIREQQDKKISEIRLREQNELNERAELLHIDHIKQLGKWMKSLPDFKWDFDLWDIFISTLQPPVKLRDLERRRDRGILDFDENLMEHLATGLLWTRNGNLSGKAMPYAAAVDWVKDLCYCGYSDWRLPTKEELEKFIKAGGFGPTSEFRTSEFNSVKDSVYWSSDVVGTTKAWSVNIVDGLPRSTSMTGGFVCYIWPVKSLG